MNKYIRVLTVIQLLSFIFIGGCTTTNNAQSKIYDNEEAQLQQGDSYTFVNNLGEREDEKVNIRFTNFTGLYSIWDVTASVEQTLTLSIKGSIERGEFKIIAITPDQKVIKIWEGEGDGDKSLKIPSGTTVIKWVGKGTSGKITMELSHQEGIQSKARKD